jgi:hypothetical protein
MIADLWLSVNQVLLNLQRRQVCFVACHFWELVVASIEERLPALSRASERSGRGSTGYLH